MSRRSLLPSILVGVAWIGPSFCAAGAQTTLQPDRFTDPGRIEKLESAFPELERVAARWARERGVPGLAWGVVIDGELAKFGSFGVKNVETQGPIDEDTVFRIASMTKSFTALAILKLRDAGRLDLDAPVATYIPELASLEPPTRDSGPITVRDLLTHSAGFPEDNPWGDRQMALSEEELSRWLSQPIPFSTATGSGYEYSNYGYAMLGRVVTNVSGRPYTEYVSEEILQPLGLRSAVWDAGEVSEEHLASGYREQDDEFVAEVPLGNGAFAAIGGLFISSRDLAKWVAVMLSAFPPRDDPESPPALRRTVREMQRGAGFPRIGISRSLPGEGRFGVASVYGFGLYSRWDCDLGWQVGHSGGFPGFGSNMVWLPEYGVGAFAMANLTYSSPWRMLQEMLRVLRESGGLQRRQAIASSALDEVARGVTALVDGWSDEEAAALAANNLFLDDSLERRRQDIAALREGLGPCAAGPIDAENALRGSFRIGCQQGWLDVGLTLAPTRPPRVQSLEVTGGRNPGREMRAAIDGVLQAMQRGPGRLEAAESADLAAMGALLHWQYQLLGACTEGELQSGDGVEETTVRLNCDRGTTDLTLKLELGKLLRVDFDPPPGEDCAP